MDFLVVFHTYSGVLKLEKDLKKLQIEFESMPAPRFLSIDCGVSIKFYSDISINSIIDEINTTNIYKIFNIINDDYNQVFIND